MTGSVYPAWPSVVDVSTLGRKALVGELYDQRSEKFLGVQLYSQDSNIKDVVTVPHTELILSGPLNTYQQKAALLDISPQLSLQALSGVVRPAGSATYLNDAKANTYEFAFALALKSHYSEKRLLVTEPEVGRDFFPMAVEACTATHFVSSIVYGGNVVVNLVVKRFKSPDESIDDLMELRAALEKLKGSIRLGGSVAQTEIKKELAALDDNFDFVIHSDVTIDKVPINPKDLLDTFPAAVAEIRKSGGVPIWVTLQPIPFSFSGRFPACLYPLHTDSVYILLTAFSSLDDLRGRLSVLQDRAKELEDLAPRLFQTCCAVSAAYTRDHSALLNELARFLLEHQNGKNPDYARISESAIELYKSHSNPSRREPEISTKYPSSIAGLEGELYRILVFMQGLEYQGGNLQITEYLSRLKNIEQVVWATATQQKNPLFIATPFSGGVAEFDSVIRKYLGLIRKYADLFKDDDNLALLFYAEDLEDLERRLPNGGMFSKLKSPALFFSNVDDHGGLTWDPVSE